MPQSKWERGFWASVRDKDNILPNGKEFKPYPPEHWRKPKTNRKRKVNKKLKSDFIKNHVKVVGIPDIGKQLTFFD